MPREDQVPKWRKVNGTQLANILGISPQRISTLLHSGLPRIEESKLYDLAQCIPWIVQRTMEKGDLGGSGSARQLYYEAMAERAMLDSEKLKGHLYGKAETDQFIMGLSSQLRERVLALPARVTRDRTIQAELDREISGALKEMATAVALWCGDGDPGAGPVKATTRKKRGPVGKRAPPNARRKPAPGPVQKRRRAVSG